MSACVRDISRAPRRPRLVCFLVWSFVVSDLLRVRVMFCCKAVVLFFFFRNLGSGLRVLVVGVFFL